MFPLLDSWGFESKQTTLNFLFHSRLKLALIVIVVQILALSLTMRPFFFLSLFNIPALLALLFCFKKKNLCDYKAQKNIRILLKIGIAKAVGGVCSAVYMNLKYAYLPLNSGINAIYGQNHENHLKLCAIYFTISALVDILYSFIAKDMLRNTKKIITILKENRKVRSPKSRSPRQIKMPEITGQIQELSPIKID